MHELHISMLGPRGVGKTSLLTAMYEQFESSVGATNLQLTPDLESSALLQERLAELKSLAIEFHATGGINGTAAPGGPSSLRSFVFDLGKKGTKPSLRLHFHDFPGGYLLGSAQKEEREHVKTLLQKSAVVMVAIDTPALLEGPKAPGAFVGRWHDEVNRPQQMTDLFKAAYAGLEDPRLVVFAPIKCEKWMVNHEQEELLKKGLREGYPKLLDFLASDALRGLVGVVSTPIQTVGVVHFSTVEERNGRPHFTFRKLGRDASYSPRDSEQPLRHALKFLLGLHLQKRKWGAFDFIRKLFQSDEHLKKAVHDFASGCKTQGAFTVVQAGGRTD